MRFASACNMHNIDDDDTFNRTRNIAYLQANIIMDGLFAAASMKLNAGFEVRRSAAGVDVICAKDEKWDAAATPEPPSATSAVNDMAAAFAKLAIGIPPAASAPAKAAPLASKQYKVSALSLEERFASVRKVGEECIQASSECPSNLQSSTVNRRFRRVEPKRSPARRESFLNGLGQAYSIPRRSRYLIMFAGGGAFSVAGQEAAPCLLRRVRAVRAHAHRAGHFEIHQR